MTYFRQLKNLDIAPLELIKKHVVLAINIMLRWSF
jgi:hypothetical protein